MKKLSFFFLLVVVLTTSSFAQFGTRQDAIWARTVSAGTITLDGNLNEAAWTAAEKITLTYGQPGALPTSGWRPEFQAEAITDPTHATVSFLVQGNQLFLGFYIPDSSIGGNADWARWDGILMSVKDVLNRDANTKVAAAAEYFYTYWTTGLTNTDPVVGAQPRFVGKWANWDGTPRTPEQINAWDAITTFKGTSNDAGRDTSFTIEMKIDLGVIGYDVAKAEGDVVCLNFSIWDCDYLFEGNPAIINSTRTWWQAPWGNANIINVARIFARPDVTVNTTTLPTIRPEVIVPNGAAYANPNIDGKLYEEVWSKAQTFNIKFDDAALRSTYPGAGKVMSGQFQPELNGNPRPPVLDANLGTFKMYFKDNFLYLGATVADQLVQGTENYDKNDGIGFIIGKRDAINEENNFDFKVLRVSFGATGAAAAYDYLPNLVDSSGGLWAAALKGATTVNVNSDVDSGYSVEMKVDLTKLGYPANLGDKFLFMGAVLYDGDSFDDTLNNYGTRAWWFRENAGGPACAWMYMDANTPVGVNDEVSSLEPESFVLYGNYPNPFNPSTKIRYAVPASGEVQVTVYNSMGEEVRVMKQTVSAAGTYDQMLQAEGLSSGVYYYSIKFVDNVGQKISNLSGKMIYLK